MGRQYTLNDFDYELPAGLIAQVPVKPRDHSRLLIYDRGKRHITDDYFYNIDHYLPLGSTIVVNNSKVEKCRLRIAGSEIFVLDTITPTTIKALVKPGRKFKLGSLRLGDLSLSVEEIDSEGIRTIVLDRPINDPSLKPFFLTPLPPYIAQNENLATRYQTVYADPLGSKAAPTAGLHFTQNLLEQLKKNHDFAAITLHVGLGTFMPVKTSDLSKHSMHAENYFVDMIDAKKLNSASHITAVGTTTTRTLESLGKPFRVTSGSTNIFIRPGYKFRNVDALITNFHLPKSTLLMLVAAFLGSVDELHYLYGHAIASKYRFYSFGDAMLII